MKDQPVVHAHDRPRRRQAARASRPRGRSAIRSSACAAFAWRCKHAGLFRTQLRAILRASVAGNISIMFPLVSTLLELQQAKMVLADAMEDLEEEGMPSIAT